jgi:hypothetical protein
MKPKSLSSARSSSFLWSAPVRWPSSHHRDRGRRRREIGRDAWTDYPNRPGVKLAVIEGDLAKAGPFLMRVKFPAGGSSSPRTRIRRSSTPPCCRGRCGLGTAQRTMAQRKRSDRGRSSLRPPIRRTSSQPRPRRLSRHTASVRGPRPQSNDDGLVAEAHRA